MPDYEKLYEERKTRVETAIANGQPDRVPNVLMVGFYPIRQAGITMAESMVDHERTCRATYEFYEKHPMLDTASASNFMPAAKFLENLDVKTARWPGETLKKDPGLWTQTRENFSPALPPTLLFDLC